MGTVLIEEDKYAYSIYIDCHSKLLQYIYWDNSAEDFRDWTSCYCVGSKTKVTSDEKFYQKVSVTHWINGDISAVLSDLYYAYIEFNSNYPNELVIYYDTDTGYCKEAVMQTYCYVEKDGAEQKLKSKFETSGLGKALSNYSIDIVEQSDGRIRVQCPYALMWT